MKRILLIASALMLTCNYTLAQDLILSDVIREAREAQIKQAAKEKSELAMMQPVKNETPKKEAEQKPDSNSCQQQN